MSSSRKQNAPAMAFLCVALPFVTIISPTSTASAFLLNENPRSFLIPSMPSLRTKTQHLVVSRPTTMSSMPSAKSMPSAISIFPISIHPKQSPIRSCIELQMARGGIHGKKKRMLDSVKKKKKTKDPSKPTGKFRKTRKRDRNDANTKRSKSNDGDSTKIPKPYTTGSSNSRPKIAILGETKKHGPPWQVMNGKEQEKFVEAEKIRRERIRLGIDSPSAPTSIDSDSISKKADASRSSRLLSPSTRSLLSWKRFNPESTPSELVFVGSYLDKRLPPSLGAPEIAFLGRSNVGKSSLLNRLAYKAGGDTARVGKTPGATASVNLYGLLGSTRGRRREWSDGRAGGGGGEAKPILGFVDLPGFGYAKLSKETKESVEEAAERYLNSRRELALGILLVDSRRTPNADDRAVLAALYDIGVPLAVVATKCDKLRANDVESAMNIIREELGLPEGQPFRVSSATGEGVRDLWRIVLEACEMRVKEIKDVIEEGKDDGGVLRNIWDGVDEKENGEYEGSDFYDDSEFDDIDEEGSTYDGDDDDVHYDQGYDWIQNSNSEQYGIDNISDLFYDGDEYVEDEQYEYSSQKSTGNLATQITGEESLKLKNLKKVVQEMEKRGEI